MWLSGAPGLPGLGSLHGLMYTLLLKLLRHHLVLEQPVASQHVSQTSPSLLRGYLDQPTNKRWGWA